MAILTDSEFLSLNLHQQLRILTYIYSMLENYLKRQYGGGKKKEQKRPDRRLIRYLIREI